MTGSPFRAFHPKALAFLRALKRNNDREWFRSRKTDYEQLLRQPMTEAIERLAVDLRVIAPELEASPKASLFRIYRDTRFSDDKSPLKTHVAAVFPCKGLGKHVGAGLYFEVSPGWVWVGGGMYAPDVSTLQLVREHIAANLRRWKTTVESSPFRRAVGRLDGERLQRVPRGFSKDHPAAEYLTLRQFLAGREFPPAFATSPLFYTRLVATFRAVAPVVRFLNEPLLKGRGPHRRLDRTSL